MKNTSGTSKTTMSVYYAFFVVSLLYSFVFLVCYAPFRIIKKGIHHLSKGKNNVKVPITTHSQPSVTSPNISNLLIMREKGIAD